MDVHSNTNTHIQQDKQLKKHSCDVCAKALSRSSHLNEHKRIHTGQRSYPCDECGKAFSQKSNLTRHMRYHAGVKPFSCDVCGKRFLMKQHMTEHKRTHTGEKPYSCDICQKSFTHTSGLFYHEKSVHLKAKVTKKNEFLCERCEMVFPKGLILVQHKRESHNYCGVCGEYFPDKNRLNTHKDKEAKSKEKK